MKYVLLLLIMTTFACTNEHKIIVGITIKTYIISNNNIKYLTKIETNYWDYDLNNNITNIFNGYFSNNILDGSFTITAYDSNDNKSFVFVSNMTGYSMLTKYYYDNRTRLFKELLYDNYTYNTNALQYTYYLYDDSNYITNILLDNWLALSNATNFMEWYHTNRRILKLFDSKKRLIESFDDNQVHFFDHKYIYDEFDRVTFEFANINYEYESDPYYISNFYTKNKQITYHLKTNYSLINKSITEYDSQSNAIKIVTFSSNNSITLSEEFSYNGNKLLSSVKRNFLSKDSVWSYYSYNDIGLVTQSVIRNRDSILLYKYRYKLTNIIEAEVYSNNIIQSRRVYDYIYK